MNYSTFNINNFFIKKNATYPELKYPLIQQIREKYDITDDMLENVAVTFSMIDSNTGLYRVANVAADLLINKTPIYPDDEKFILIYKFKQSDTKKSGVFFGEFVIDFLNDDDSCFKLKLPVESYININISDSITKTTVI